MFRSVRLTFIQDLSKMTRRCGELLSSVAGAARHCTYEPIVSCLAYSRCP